MTRLNAAGLVCQLMMSWMIQLLNGEAGLAVTHQKLWPINWNKKMELAANQRWETLGQLWEKFYGMFYSRKRWNNSELESLIGLLGLMAAWNPLRIIEIIKMMPIIETDRRIHEENTKNAPSNKTRRWRRFEWEECLKMAALFCHCLVLMEPMIWLLLSNRKWSRIRSCYHWKQIWWPVWCESSKKEHSFSPWRIFEEANVAAGCPPK